MSIKIKASDVLKINFGIIILINLLDIIHYCVVPHNKEYIFFIIMKKELLSYYGYRLDILNLS